MGTHKEGGIRVKEMMLKNDPDYYRKTGAKGGKTLKTKPSGFAYVKLHNPGLFKENSSRGGITSKRPKKVIL
jgi:hypothetical protein